MNNYNSQEIGLAVLANPSLNFVKHPILFVTKYKYQQIETPVECLLFIC
jgi:hypothetical protein